MQGERREGGSEWPEGWQKVKGRWRRQANHKCGNARSANRANRVESRRTRQIGQNEARRRRGACARGGGEDLPWGAAEPPLGGEGEAWPVEGKREPERKGLSGARTNEDCSTLEGKSSLGVPGPIEAAPTGGLAGEKAWPVGGDDVETGPSMP